jgi:hypothetical protein
MSRSEYNITIDGTKDIKLIYYRPQGKMNWGLDVKDSDIEHDVSTPLALMLPDFPGHHFDSHDKLFDKIAQAFLKMGIPCLGIEYRGVGDSDIYSGHLDINSAIHDISVALKWAILEDHYTKIIPITCGLSAPILFEFLDRHKIHTKPRSMLPTKEQTIHDLIKNDDLEDTKLEEKIDLSDLRVLAISLFWPVLDLNHSMLSNFLNQIDMLTAEEQAAQKKDILFKSTPLGDHIDTIQLPNEHHINLNFLRQLTQIDTMKQATSYDCPMLIQQGSDDETVGEEQLQAFKENAETKYADIQVFGGGAHGLTAKNMRSYVMRLMHDFIRKFV